MGDILCVSCSFDISKLNITTGTLDFTAAFVAKLIANADLPEKKVKGWLNIYRRSVSSADEGAILR